jgi:glycyl-tRNA synthetase beta chain
MSHSAATAGRLAKVDLVSDMVRELTELQGAMGGIYAREEGLPEAVWRAIYHHYLPAAVEQDAPPTRADLGSAALPWAALALADKLDTIVGLFAAGERPTGTRDPFGLRRQAHGALKILVDLPELAGIDVSVSLASLIDRARTAFDETAEPGSELPPEADGEARERGTFLAERLRFLFQQRGFTYDEINAVAGAKRGFVDGPFDARLRLEALQKVRRSPEFEALAVSFKRVKNLAKELGRPPAASTGRLVEPAERALLQEYASRGAAVRTAASRRDYFEAFRLASGFLGPVDRFFTEVFVMVDDADLRGERLSLVWRLHELVLDIADISEIVPRAELR